MKDALTYQVDKLLSEGRSRFHIWKRLKNSENETALRHTLNNKALLKDKKAYRYLNILLTLILLFVTTSKLLGIALIAMGYEPIPPGLPVSKNIYALVSLIVPMINMYLLKEVFFYKRSGYMFLAILTTLSLVYRENRHFPEILFVLAIIGLSSFLYVKLFPKKLLIPAPEDEKD